MWLFPFGKGDYLGVPRRVAQALPAGTACVIGLQGLEGALTRSEGEVDEFSLVGRSDASQDISSAMDELAREYEYVLAGYWGFRMMRPPQRDEEIPDETVAMFQAAHLISGVVACVIQEEADWADGYLAHAALALRGRRSVPPLLTRVILGSRASGHGESRWPCIGELPHSWWSGAPSRRRHETIERLSSVIQGTVPVRGL